MSDTEHRSTFGLISDALSQSSRLFGSELQLAKAEVSEKISSAVTAVVGIVGAGVFLVVALVFLLQALVAWMVETGWRMSTSSLIVGAAIGLLAVAAILVAKSRLSIMHLTPTRSIDEAGKIIDLVHGKERQ